CASGGFSDRISNTSFQSGDKTRHVPVAPYTTELFLGEEQPGGTPPTTHVAITPSFHISAHVSGGRERRLDQIRRRQMNEQFPRHTEPYQGERLFEPLAQTAGRVGTDSIEQRGRVLQNAQRSGVVGLVVRLIQPPANLFPVPLGNVRLQIALLVKLTSLNDRVSAPDIDDRLSQCFASVEHEQHRLVAAEPSIAELPHQRLAHLRVLRRPLPKAQNPLAPV